MFLCLVTQVFKQGKFITQNLNKQLTEIEPMSLHQLKITIYEKAMEEQEKFKEMVKGIEATCFMLRLLKHHCDCLEKLTE